MGIDATMRGEIESVIDDYVTNTAGNMEFIRDINYKRTVGHEFIMGYISGYLVHACWTMIKVYKDGRNPTTNEMVDALYLINRRMSEIEDAVTLTEEQMAVDSDNEENGEE